MGLAARPGRGVPAVHDDSRDAADHRIRGAGPEPPSRGCSQCRRGRPLPAEPSTCAVSSGVSFQCRRGGNLTGAGTDPPETSSPEVCSFQLSEVGSFRLSLTRGSRMPAARATQRARSIPAGAGKPTSSSTGPGRSRVHPRGRGEAPSTLTAEEQAQGPSPRARGSHPHQRDRQRYRGSIPAGAGKPACHATTSALRRVHPRGRGEAVGGPALDRAVAGPSPRARGSRPVEPFASVLLRSIPAGAGKPGSLRPWCRARRVHPRGRGEAVLTPGSA